MKLLWVLKAVIIVISQLPTTGRRSESIPVCRSVIVIVVSGNASTTLFLISLQNTKIEWPVSIKMFTRLYPLEGNDVIIQWAAV